MSDILSKIFAVILVIGLLIVYPILHMASIQEDTTRIFVLSETTKFVDMVRDVGYISPDTYEDFSRQLLATNNIYDIEIEHLHKVINPIYTDPLDITTFQDDFSENYEGHYTATIMAQLFPDTGSGSDYRLSKGDYIVVEVVNKNKTFGTKIREMIFGVNMPEETIYVRYGGVVRYEDN
jgi:hypothetical protein